MMKNTAFYKIILINFFLLILFQEGFTQDARRSKWKKYKFDDEIELVRTDSFYNEFLRVVVIDTAKFIKKSGDKAMRIWTTESNDYFGEEIRHNWFSTSSVCDCFTLESGEVGEIRILSSNTHGFGFEIYIKKDKFTSSFYETYDKISGKKTKIFLKENEERISYTAKKQRLIISKTLFENRVLIKGILYFSTKINGKKVDFYSDFKCIEKKQ